MTTKEKADNRLQEFSLPTMGWVGGWEPAACNVGPGDQRPCPTNQVGKSGPCKSPTSRASESRQLQRRFLSASCQLAALSFAPLPRLTSRPAAFGLASFWEHLDLHSIVLDSSFAFKWDSEVFVLAYSVAVRFGVAFFFPRPVFLLESSFFSSYHNLVPSR